MLFFFLGVDHAFLTSQILRRGVMGHPASLRDYDNLKSGPHKVRSKKKVLYKRVRQDILDLAQNKVHAVQNLIQSRATIEKT